MLGGKEAGKAALAALAFDDEDTEKAALASPTTLELKGLLR